MPFWPLSWLSIALLGLLLLNRTARPFASVWRARWLLLAIFILYAGFTVGEPVLPQFPGISREGLLEATRRCAVLVVLIQAVNLLMHVTPLPQLIQGLVVLLKPLQLVGFDHQGFARRLGLVLDQVVVVQQRLSVARSRTPDSWADTAAEIITQIEAHAASLEVRR